MTLVAAMVVFALMVLAMAVGVLLGGKPLKGSCGGLNQSGQCELCGARSPGDCAGN